VNVWTELILLRGGSVSGFYEHGNEPLGSIKGKKCVDRLRTIQVLKNGSAPCSYCDAFLRVLLFYRSQPCPLDLAGCWCVHKTRAQAAFGCSKQQKLN
jgi:hypothetical protein